MQKFESRGRVYSLPDTATHAAPGAFVGLYFKDGGKWFFTGDLVTDVVQPILFGKDRGFFDHDIVELKPQSQPFAFWNKIKGALFK